MLKQIVGLLVLVFLFAPIHCRSRHVINFRLPDLYPASFAWDPKSDHFVVGSLRDRRLISVSDADVVSALHSDDSLPEYPSFPGISLDPSRRRLLAVVRSLSPPYSAVAAYDLPSFAPLFLTPLDGLLPSSVAPKHVAVDYSGNVYVTDSANDVIYRVTEQGEATILSRSQVFKCQSEGLNGVVYNPNGYLLVIKSSSGKLFKVNTDDGSAREVILNKEIAGAESISIWRDGVVLVASPSQKKLYFIKSDDSWSQGAVFDESTLDGERLPAAVTVGAEDRVYALYGNAKEGEEWSIVEMVSEVENKEDKLWIFVLMGLGLGYFTFWRFQMKKLVQNMNKKTA